MTADLPPGQHARDDFPRFGLPAFAARWPAVPPEPVLRLAAEGDAGREIALAALAALPRRELVADLHCVTTWTRRGLAWGGYRLGDVVARFLPPGPAHRFILAIGRDGYRASLPLEDALADDVFLADRLDGAPLPLEHGAPLRLVAPAHYGYKSVRHLGALELRYQAPRTSAGMPHPRARVAFEERASGVPGAWLRLPYRALVPLTVWWHRRAARRRGTGE